MLHRNTFAEFIMFLLALSLAGCGEVSPRPQYSMGIRAFDELGASVVDICVVRVQRTDHCEIHMTIDNHEEKITVDPYLDIDFDPNWGEARSPAENGLAVPRKAEESDTRMIVQFPPIPPGEGHTELIATYPVNCNTIKWFKLYQAWDGEPSVKAWHVPFTGGYSDRPILMVPKGGYWCELCSPSIPEYHLWHITHIDVRHAAAEETPDEDWSCSGKSSQGFWEWLE